MDDKNQTMTIGKMLRKAREKHRYSLEDVERVIHIRQRFLAALENDQIDDLPSLVQGKGFLRLYADYLGLAVQPLLDTWERQISPPAPQPAQRQGKRALRKKDSAAKAPEETIAQPEEINEEEELIPGEEAEIPFEPVDTTAGQGSQAKFKTIGQQLRVRREKLSLSLPDVAHYTHVKRHYLQALEEGRLHDLLSPVQARGLLNNYARFLELDVDSLLLQYAEGLQTRFKEQQKQEAKKGIFASKRFRQATAWSRLLTPDLVIGSIVIIGLFAFALWSAAQISATRSKQLTNQPTMIAGVLQSTITPWETPNATVSPFPSPGSPGGALLPEGSGENVTTGDAQQPAESGPVQVYVIARQRAWMKVTVDRQTTFNGRVIPGNAYTFTGRERIELITGNAAALQVFYNQNDIGTLGISGEVASLIFTEGSIIITPTAMFSPTPTATAPETLTPQPSPTVPTATVTAFIP